MASNSSSALRPFPPFLYQEIRQVQVRNIPGLTYLPVVPEFGTNSPITRVPNGTFICFQDQTWGGPDEDCCVWVFALKDNPQCRFNVSPEALDYLWKVKLPNGLRTR